MHPYDYEVALWVKAALQAWWGPGELPLTKEGALREPEGEGEEASCPEVLQAPVAGQSPAQLLCPDGEEEVDIDLAGDSISDPEWLRKKLPQFCRKHCENLFYSGGS